MFLVIKNRIFHRHFVLANGTKIVTDKRQTSCLNPLSGHYATAKRDHFLSQEEVGGVNAKIELHYPLFGLLFVCVDAFHPSQQFSVMSGRLLLPLTIGKSVFHRTQYSASSEQRTSDPSIPSLTLYH